MRVGVADVPDVGVRVGVDVAGGEVAVDVGVRVGVDVAGGEVAVDVGVGVGANVVALTTLE